MLAREEKEKEKQVLENKRLQQLQGNKEVTNLRHKRKKAVGDLNIGPNLAICSIENCTRVRLQEKIPFCAPHLTPQYAVELTKDPLEAARLLEEVAQALKQLEKEKKKPFLLKKIKLKQKKLIVLKSAVCSK